jgi:hypothetical protein
MPRESKDVIRLRHYDKTNRNDKTDRRIVLDEARVFEMPFVEGSI